MLIPSSRVKIQVFCPSDAADAVREAIGNAGGGRVGNYEHCVSVTDTIGYFRPLPGAHPAIGRVGTLEKVVEVKIEFVCEEERVETVLEAIRSVHPYEEIAYDIIPLLVVDA